MQNQTISSRQAICMITTFLIGSSILLGVSARSGQDSWIAILCSLIFTIPVVLMYSRIMRLFPEKDIYDIIIELFGRIGGKIIIVLIIWYIIHLSSLVLKNFSEFIKVVSLPETPRLPVMILMILIVVYIGKSGIAVLAKWSVVVLPIILIVVTLTTAMAINHMDFTNILPIMNHKPSVIIGGAYETFAFPFGETVVFLVFADSIQMKINPYKLYFKGIICGLIVLLVVFIRNILILGPIFLESEYFPSYVAVRIINIGDFLARIEGSISMNFILAGITKITFCVIAASKGIAKLFNIKDYKKMIMPTSLLVLALCAIVYTSTMEMFAFLKIYKIYAIPFQIIIPTIIWITGEIRKKSKSSAN